MRAVRTTPLPTTRYEARTSLARNWGTIASVLWLALQPAGLSAWQADTTATEGPRVGHGPRGFFIESTDGSWSTNLQFRLQFRFSHPYDTDPVTWDDFVGDPSTTFEVNRARFKVGGHGFRPWLRYYFEYELASSNLLNFEVTVERSRRMGLRVGQWKAQYSRERATSSGREQLVDRSLINRYFTLDRQQGVSIFGRLAEGTRADVNYWVSTFTGMGRGGRHNDDEHLMYMARVQWNPLGRPVPFVGSDLNRSAPTLSIAVAGTTNRSPCTRFSQEGCGSLDRFPGTDPGQYRVRQALFETALLWRGLAWSQELHWKRVEDREDGAVTELGGNYLQVGYFPSAAWASIPEPLEVAVRWSVLRPDLDLNETRYDEISVAANWFLSGHDNKLTAEITWLTLRSPVEDLEEGARFRIQWDVQF